MLALPRADREQCAAFIVRKISFSNQRFINFFSQRDERVMVIWAEALDRIVPLCQDVEERLIKLLWRARPSGPSTATSQAGQSPSLAHSHMSAYSASAAGSLADHGSSDAAHPLAMRRGLYGEQGRGLEPDEKGQVTTTVESVKGGATRRRWRRTWYGRKVPIREAVSTRDEDEDPNKEDVEVAVAGERRPVRLYAPLYNGLAAGIALGVFFGYD